MPPGEGGSVAVVREWIAAYDEYRNEAMLELAHPEIVIRPRRGQGAPEYRGPDGVRQWLGAVGMGRPTVTVVSFEDLHDGRVVADSLIGDMSVIAVFEIREERVFSVEVYVSDREMLEQVGIIRDPARQRAS